MDKIKESRSVEGLRNYNLNLFIILAKVMVCFKRIRLRTKLTLWDSKKYLNFFNFDIVLFYSLD